MSLFYLRIEKTAAGIKNSEQWTEDNQKNDEKNISVKCDTCTTQIMQLEGRACMHV